MITAGRSRCGRRSGRGRRPVRVLEIVAALLVDVRGQDEPVEIKLGVPRYRG